MTTLNHHLPAALGTPASTAAPARPATHPAGAEDAPRGTSGPAGHDASHVSARGRALTSSEFTAVATVAALVAVLGLLGFVNSFAAVAEASRPSFGRLAWTVPLGIDLGIAIFAALDIVLARLDMRIRWLRFIPWGLTAATVYLNIAGEHGVFGKVAHAVLPALWVIAVEIAAHVIRIRAGIANGTRMDGIRTSRWILAPWPTLKLWRRMVLWEIRSYPDALNRERARVLALTDLQDTYGRWAWRRHAPRRVRALYRLGELPTTLPAQAAPGEASSDPSGGRPMDGPALAPVDRPALDAGPSRAPSRTARRTAAARSGGRGQGRSAARSRTGRAAASVPDVDELMPTGRRIAAELAAAGEPLTRNTLAARLREAGHTAGNARVGALLARLKTEPANPPSADPTADPSATVRAEDDAPSAAEGDTRS
ncbi:DUF2637 domain-containing protein [Actinomadura sp. NAK00032]|uniref:DUF2637 domain-containing protein n=1 Tax=Actinomadura sp. NAK00032 TaxID=2742128 RepID=UPI001591BF49|nr:DUF2637 domain-containing protein [Actinomadura sp. NAK00032]QKW35006.1 DUF2637 domain-containing protein [Actinomadura sp. NAK00032]